MLPPFLELFRYERSSFRYSGYPLDLNKSHVCETVFFIDDFEYFAELKSGILGNIYRRRRVTRDFERDIGYVTFNLDSGLDCV